MKIFWIIYELLLIFSESVFIYYSMQAFKDYWREKRHLSFTPKTERKNMKPLVQFKFAVFISLIAIDVVTLYAMLDNIKYNILK